MHLKRKRHLVKVTAVQSVLKTYRAVLIDPNLTAVNVHGLAGNRIEQTYA
jgi:hypothetical protein